MLGLGYPIVIQSQVCLLAGLPKLARNSSTKKVFSSILKNCLSLHTPNDVANCDNAAF